MDRPRSSSPLVRAAHGGPKPLRVAIIGGGVAGLSAAHELSERGFAVTVLEARSVFGGRARSIPVPGSGTGGRDDLPGEHGFRFFPGFYTHLDDTMRRIPSPGGGTVLDRLVATRQTLWALEHGHAFVTPNGGLTPRRLADEFLDNPMAIPLSERLQMLRYFLAWLTSCDERRYGEFDALDWWRFVDAEHRSASFRRFLADGLTRCLVAARAREMSARTGLGILWQLHRDSTRPSSCAARVLCGPTSPVWFEPWIALLGERGVTLHTDAQVERLDYRDKRICGFTVARAGHVEYHDADYIVLATPLQVTRQLLDSQLRAADPGFADLDQLPTRWMNGVQLFLDRPVDLGAGHVLFIDSPWSLTAIAQDDFWPHHSLRDCGDGRVLGIVSVVISDWQTPGRACARPARHCSRDEIRDEVLDQMYRGLPPDMAHQLASAELIDWFLDPAIEHIGPRETVNHEPMPINKRGSWQYRPDAATAVANLVLAGDYVRTGTDLACMESANESARHAVNAILERSGSLAPRCQVFKPAEPAWLRPARSLDQLVYRMGHKHPLLPDMRPGR